MTDTAVRILQLADDQARRVDDLGKYYGTDAEPGTYEGRFFDSWKAAELAPGGKDVFTAEDVIATSFLSVHVPPAAARAILEPGPKNAYNALLRETRADQDFWDADAPHRQSSQWQLEAKLMELPGVGLTTASKLMARKRPRLVPVNDSVVRSELSLQKTFWAPLYDVFQSSDLAVRLATLDDEARRQKVDLPQDLSALRLLDVIVWMAGTSKRGLPSPQVGDSDLLT